MQCRENCGACCIMPSISSAIPGMPNGKPGGVRCIHLTGDFRCAIFHSPDRPKVCGGFKAEPLVCGSSRVEALQILGDLEGVPVAQIKKAQGI
ncbi:MAG: YkgJ family cysteine cluster protein [Breznakibacter sp.]